MQPIVNQNFDCANCIEALNPYLQGGLIVGGTALVVCLIQPATALGFLAAAVAGAVGSFILYAIGEVSYATYLHWKHRVAAPLLLDPHSPQFRGAFETALERVKEHPQFAFFTEVEKLNDDQAVYTHLFRYIHIGLCHGSASRLLHALNKMPHLSSRIVLSSIDITDIFYLQLLDIIQASFKAAAANEIRNRAIRAGFAHLLKDQPEEPSKVSEYVAAIKEIQQMLTPCKEIHSEPIAIKEDAAGLKNELFALIGAHDFSGQDFFNGTVEIRGLRADANGRPRVCGHVVFFQIALNTFRYYDTINEFDGGFFEYPTLDEFVSALRNQLLSDMHHCENLEAIINLQTTDLITEPDSEASEPNVSAGA